MEDAKRVSLSDFAKVTAPGKPGTQCWACGIAEADEINESRRQGVSIAVILKWLRDECGYSPDTATRNKLKNHFTDQRHHER